jgi:hypothetical protein
MAVHYCSSCGELHGEESPVEVAEAVDDGPSDAEVVAEVAKHALDTVEHIVDAHEETEQAEVVGDVIETLAEESSEVAVAEAVAEGNDGAEPGDEVEPEEEPEPADDAEPDEEGDGSPEEGDGTPEVTGHSGEATAIGVPPQIDEDPARAPSRSPRKASAFRARRARARR